jgi:hypothetical protein
MAWLVILVYTFAAFGLCNMVAFGSGPFRIFEKLREWSEGISEHFGLLFKCMMCLPANFGWIMSLINWFLIPVAITPFNIILAGTGLWWLAMVLDCCFTTGAVWLLYVIDEWFEQEIPEKETASEPDYDQEDGYVEITPKIDKKTKKMLLND